MTIDAHVHLVGISPAHGCLFNPRAASVPFRQLQRAALRLFAPSRTRFDRRARRRLLRLARSSALDYVGLLALDGVYDARGRLDEAATSVLVGNDYLFEVADDSPKYLPIPSINPQRRDALDELERVAELGAAAVKTLPNAQNFDPADPRFRPFWRRMADLGLPLLSHTGIEFTLPEHETCVGAPERLRSALDEGLTVIAAHCGTAGGRGLTTHLDQWLNLLEPYPHLYGDLSALVSPARAPFLKRILAHPLARERILLGSDYPVPVTPILFARSLGLRKAARLQMVRNPLQRNLDALRALGVGRAAESRAANVLRMPGRHTGRHPRRRAA